MNKKIKVFSLGLGLIGVGILMTPQSGKAAGFCVNCHTMHNSQNGTFIPGNTPTPNDALINKGNGCIGCHSGTNSGGADIVPYVLDTLGDPAATSLAGGNFWWVATGAGYGGINNKGHNVVGISDPDTTITTDPLTPPGWNAGFDAHTKVNGGVAAPWTAQLTCAGTNGCHGRHEIAGLVTVGDFEAVKGAHHTDDSVINGLTVGTSFRFLFGILGIEDPEWEYPSSLSASVHNQYKGFARTSDTTPAAAAASINYLCAECHGNFHSGTGALGTTFDDSAVSPWIRHPTDIDMLVLGGEFLDYGGASHAYVPLVPVASQNLGLGVLDIVIPGESIVSCISCHRAHGSEFVDLLRWDYSTCYAGIGNGAAPGCGCFACHTGKDD
jgi:Zn-finger protein